MRFAILVIFFLFYCSEGESKSTKRVFKTANGAKLEVRKITNESGSSLYVEVFSGLQAEKYFLVLSNAETFIKALFNANEQFKKWTTTAKDYSISGYYKPIATRFPQTKVVAYDLFSQVFTSVENVNLIPTFQIGPSGKSTLHLVARSGNENRTYSLLFSKGRQVKKLLSLLER